MILTYKKWDSFCRALKNAGIKSIPADKVTYSENNYLVLKHDVETDVNKAYKMAKIEAGYGHRGSYYVQAYLMNDKNNIKCFPKCSVWDMRFRITMMYWTVTREILKELSTSFKAIRHFLSRTVLF